MRAGSVFPGRREQIHKGARGLAIALVLESHIEIRRRTQHVQQAPQRETLLTVARQTQINLDAVDPC